jgi:c-di-GMP-binding flagellar brake protein YcgR
MEARLPGVEVNRRTARRIQLKFPLWFQTQQHPDEVLSGMVQNISAAGVVFVTQALVEVFTRVKLFLDRLPGDRQSRHIDGVVTRTEMAGEPGQYLIGVQFIDVSEEDQAHIVAALQATDVMGLLRFTAKKGASDPLPLS